MSGRTGQAGLVVQCRVVKALDVELDVVTAQLQASTVDRVLA